MRNILLKLSFVGTNYFGWQRQKHHISIQQLIEEAVLKVTDEASSVIGCSRTDAGVHAEEFIANFKTSSTIPAEKFRPALQSKLPRDIVIGRSLEVDFDFNARRNSYQKTYRYQIYLGNSPFYWKRWWQSEKQDDITILNRLAETIIGIHDFSGFCVERSKKADNHCDIKQASWRREGKKLYFKITGDRFLHRMVRFLVGAQIEVANGRLTAADFAQILHQPHRKRALFPAPPDGLYLAKVKYR